MLHGGGLAGLLGIVEVDMWRSLSDVSMSFSLTRRFYHVMLCRFFYAALSERRFDALSDRKELPEPFDASQKLPKLAIGCLLFFIFQMDYVYRMSL